MAALLDFLKQIFLPAKLIHFGDEVKKERRRVARKKRLKPHWRVSIRVEVDEGSDADTKLGSHGVDVAKNPHVVEADLDTHESSMMHRWTIPHFDFR